jgi:small-conductance mechanosensitive channel
VIAHQPIERVAGALIVLLVTVVLARFAARWVYSLGRRTEHRLFSLSLYSTLVQTAILIVGVLTVLSSLDIAIAPILTALGVGGLAVALALNDTLTNLFAGIQIITAHQLRVGDYVRFDFGEGEVTDIQWHNTTIRDLQNNLVVIPNAKVNTSVFTNYSRAAGEVIVPVAASLAWKGSASSLREVAQKAAQGSDVVLSAVNETNMQVTAYIPVKNVRERTKKAAEFLDRLYDAAHAANMGVQKN